jgi:hypothetical protein
MCKGPTRLEMAGCALDLLSNVYSVEVIAPFNIGNYNLGLR